MPRTHTGNWRAASTTVDEAGAPLHIHRGGRHYIPHAETIAGITAMYGRFSRFSSASEAAGLSATLAAAGAFTVLVPTDEVFEQLPTVLMERLMQPDNRQRLRDILLYHVSPGVIDSTQLRCIDQLPTPHGIPVPVRTQGERTLLADATLVQPDIVATNGIIHVIDSVLRPPRRGPNLYPSFTGSQRSLDTHGPV